jgi:hypothetical protein
MGFGGDFYNQKKKKLSKEEQAKKASKQAFGGGLYTPPAPAVIPKGKNKNTGNW